MGRLSKYDEVLQQENLEVVEVHYYHRLVQVIVRELRYTNVQYKNRQTKGSRIVCNFVYHLQF